MLDIDLKGKRALVVGIADDRGYGWAIAKALKKAGAELLAGTWPPVLKIFTKSLESGKLDVDLGDGDGDLSFEKIYPVDAMYDILEDVPDEIKNNKRYVDIGDFTIAGIAQAVEKDFGKGGLHVVIHSLANAPEINKALIQTSRQGYLSSISASAYSFVRIVAEFSPIMARGGSFLTLTFMASNRVMPGYGGAMSTAKAALESDTRTLSFDAGRVYGHRINSISAGPLKSRAAMAIGSGFVETMIGYSDAHAPLGSLLTAEDIGSMAAFLSSDLAKAVTGTVIYVDNGLHVMGKTADRIQKNPPTERSLWGLPEEDE